MPDDIDLDVSDLTPDEKLDLIEEMEAILTSDADETTQDDSSEN